MRGHERDRPRNPGHRGGRPVCNGGEDPSGRLSRRERTRLHRDHRRDVVALIALSTSGTERGKRREGWTVYLWDVACAGQSWRFPVGDLRIDGCAGSPTGDGCAIRSLGLSLASRRVTAGAKRRQDPCEPGSAGCGRERDRPRNSGRRGGGPVCCGGEGPSGRSLRREWARLHRGLSRRRAGKRSVRS